MNFSRLITKYIRSKEIEVHVGLDDDSSIFLSFNHDPTLLEVQNATASYCANYAADHQYDSTAKAEIDLLEHRKLLKDLIIYIKARPSLTLTQWNTMLGTRLWWEAAIARYFVYSLAIFLARNKGISLEDMTEATVLRRLRDWIVNTSIQVIQKTVTGNPNNGD
jgi:hypothetical protein